MITTTNNTSRFFAALLCLWFAPAMPLVHAAPLSAAGQATTTASFCKNVQISIMGISIPADNTVHPDWDAFVLSKASVDPLRNEQFASAGPDGKPRMVSCKMKTPDHIREVYGDDASNEEARSCKAINRENVAAVIAALTAEEQERRVISDDQIIFDEDLTEFMGVNWLKPFDLAYGGDAGRLHIQSKRLQVDWTNILFKLAPDRFRGALYCHLMAPEYVKALVLGETEASSPM